jgi:hypothetical protein
MSAPWKTLIVETTFWIAAEVLLNVTGLDNLADYSEFMNYQVAAAPQQPVLVQSRHAVVTSDFLRLV